MYKENGKVFSSKNSDKTRVRVYKEKRKGEHHMSLTRQYTEVIPCRLLAPGDGNKPGRKQEKAFARMCRRRKKHINFEQRMIADGPPWAPADGLSAWFGRIKHPAAGEKIEIDKGAFQPGSDLKVLQQWLNSRQGSADYSPLEEVKKRIADTDLLATETRDVEIYRDNYGIIYANPRSSCRFVFLTAYLI